MLALYHNCIVSYPAEGCSPVHTVTAQIEVLSTTSQKDGQKDITAEITKCMQGVMTRKLMPSKSAAELLESMAQPSNPKTEWKKYVDSLYQSGSA